MFPQLKSCFNRKIIRHSYSYAAQANGKGSLGRGPSAVRGARALARAAPHVVCRELPAEGGGGDREGPGATERDRAAAAMQRRKVDNRIRVLIENGVAERQRTLFVVVGDRGKDQVTGARPEGQGVAGDDEHNGWAGIPRRRLFPLWQKYAFVK